MSYFDEVGWENIVLEAATTRRNRDNITRTQATPRLAAQVASLSAYYPDVAAGVLIGAALAGLTPDDPRMMDLARRQLSISYPAERPKNPDNPVQRFLKGVSQTAFTILDSVQKEAWHGGLSFIAGLGEGKGLEESARASFGFSPGAIAAQSMLQGRSVNLGTGYLPGSAGTDLHPDTQAALESGTPYLQAVQNAGQLEMGLPAYGYGEALRQEHGMKVQGTNIPLTPGRAVASALGIATPEVVEPGKTAYSWVSGFVDAVGQIVDPGGAVLGAVGAVRKSANVLLHSSLVPTGVRPTVLARPINEWLTTARGAQVTEALAQNTDYLSIHRMLGKSGGAGPANAVLAQTLTEARTSSEVAEILVRAADPRTHNAPIRSLMPQTLTARALGLESASLSAGLAGAVTGNKLLSTQGIGLTMRANHSTGFMARMAAEVGARAIDPLNVDQSVNDFGEFLKVARFSDDRVGHYMGLMARRLNDPVTADQPYEAAFSAMREAGDELKERFLAEGYSVDIGNVVTRLFSEADEYRKYWLDAAGNPQWHPNKSHRFFNNGRMHVINSAHLASEYLDRNIPLPDIRAIRSSMRRLQVAESNLTSLHPHISDLADFSPNVMQMLGDQFTSRYWKPMVLLRIAWPVRVISEEQIRLGAYGLASAFNHPIQWLGYTFGNKARNDLGGDPMFEAARHQEALSQKGGAYMDNGGRPFSDDYEKAEKGIHPRHVDGAAINYEQLYNDPLAVAAAGLGPPTPIGPKIKPDPTLGPRPEGVTKLLDDFHLEGSDNIEDFTDNLRDIDAQGYAQEFEDALVAVPDEAWIAAGATKPHISMDGPIIEPEEIWKLVQHNRLTGAVYYHGAGDELPDALLPLMDVPPEVGRGAWQNWFGPGLYSTQSKRVAVGFASEGSNPVVYSTRWGGSEPARILDMEAPAPDEVRTIFRDVSDGIMPVDPRRIPMSRRQQMYGQADASGAMHTWDELLDDPSVSTFELYNEFKLRLSHGDIFGGGSPLQYRDLGDTLTALNATLGDHFDAMRHVGGFAGRSGATEDEVLLWLSVDNLRYQPKAAKARPSTDLDDLVKRYMTGDLAKERLRHVKEGRIRLNDPVEARRYVESVHARLHQYTGGEYIWRNPNLRTAGTRNVGGANYSIPSTDPKAGVEWLDMWGNAIKKKDLPAAARNALPDQAYIVTKPGNMDLVEGVANKRLRIGDGEEDFLDLEAMHPSNKGFEQLIGAMGSRYYEHTPQFTKVARPLKADVGSKWDRGVAKAFQVLMSAPTNKLSRSPAFRQFYWKRIGQMLPTMSPTLRAQVLKRAAEEGITPNGVRGFIAHLYNPGDRATVRALHDLANDFIPLSARTLSNPEAPFPLLRGLIESDPTAAPQAFKEAHRRVNTFFDGDYTFRSQNGTLAPGSPSADELMAMVDADDFAGFKAALLHEARATDFVGQPIESLEADLNLMGEVWEIKSNTPSPFAASTPMSPGGPQWIAANQARARLGLAPLPMVQPALATPGAPSAYSMRRLVYDDVEFYPDSWYDELIDDANSAGPMQLDELDELSKAFALEETKRLLYSSSRRHNGADITRVLFPFGEAWTEIISTWGRLVGENPGIIRRGQQLMNGARQSGFFYTDPDTDEEVFNYPLLGSLAKWMFEGGQGIPGSTGSALAGIGGAMTSPDEQATPQFTGRVQGLNLAFSSYMPGFGPIAQMLASRFTPLTTSDAYGMRTIRDLVLPYGPTVDDPSPGAILDSVMPVWFQKAAAAVFGPEVGGESQRLMANTTMQVFTAMLTNGEIADTPEGHRIGMDEAQRRAQSIFAIRSFASFAGPTGAGVRFEVRLDPELDPDGEAFSFQVLATAWRELIDQNGGDEVAAFEAFYSRFGLDPTAFATSKTRQVRARSVTEEGLRFQRANPQLFEDFPLTAYYANPDPADGDFDYNAYLAQLKAGDRAPLTPAEWLSQRNRLVGEIAYKTARQTVTDAEGKVRTDDATRVWLRMVKDTLIRDYPGFGFDTPGIEAGATAPQLRVEFERWLEEPELLRSPAGRGLEMYLQLRDQALANAAKAGISEQGFALANDAAPLRQWLAQAAQWIALNTGEDGGVNPDFVALWDRAYSGEVETQDETIQLSLSGVDFPVGP